MKVKQLRNVLAATQNLCTHAGDAEMARALDQLSAALKSYDSEDLKAFILRVRALRERTSRD